MKQALYSIAEASFISIDLLLLLFKQLFENVTVILSSRGPNRNRP